MSLFDTTRNFEGDLLRNIVSLRVSQDLFDDLTDGIPRRSAIATAAEMRVKSAIPVGVIARGFHYTTAIEYPFTEPYMRTRYGDGSYGVWYGALDEPTSIYETVYHMVQDESRIVGLDEEIKRERAVYDVRCDAILIDFSTKRLSHPELLGNDYGPTQAIGQRLAREGHPGLLAPSARCDGTSAAIFNIGVLSNPRLKHYLTYRYLPKEQTVVVENGATHTRISVRDGVLEEGA